MATQLNCKVVTPPGYVSGTWELAPFAPYSVGTGASALTITEPFRGDIDATGLLVVKGGTTPAQITVPASGGADAGTGILTTNFKTATSTLPGRPITLPLVETAAGVMDVAYLLSVGRAQVLTPQQAADLQTLIDRTTAAAARAESVSGLSSATATAIQTATTNAQTATANTVAATADARNSLLAAAQTRVQNALYGHRTGRGLPTFNRGAVAYLSNDGSTPFNAQQLPKFLRLSWGPTSGIAYLSFRATTGPAYDSTQPQAGGVWVRQSDLIALTGIDLLLFGYAGVELTPRKSVMSTRLAPADIVLGHTATTTSDGVQITVTVSAITRGWVFLAVEAGALGNGVTKTEFIVRAALTGAGKLDVLAPSIINGTDRMSATALPRDVFESAVDNVLVISPAVVSEAYHVGDSITNGYLVSTEAATWRAQLAGMRGWLQHNLGINGSCVCSPGTSGASPMADRIAAIPAEFGGIVTFAGGTNDYNNASACPLGAPGSTDRSTYYGAVLEVARTILRRGPSFLVLMTPIWRGDAGRTEGTRSSGFTLEQYRQAVRDVAKVVSREYPGRVTLADAGRDLSDAFAGGGYLNTDVLHPNDAGALMIARYLDMVIPRFLIEPRYPIDGQATTFGTFAASSNIGGQAGWTVYDGTATINTDGSGLVVTAPFNPGPRGVLHPLPAGARRVTISLIAPFAADQGIILRAAHRLSDDMAVCAWTTGGTLDAGTIQGGSVTSWIRSGGININLNVSAELEVLREGGSVEVRFWPSSSPRPEVPTYVHADVPVIGDAYGFSTIGTAAELVVDVTVSG